MSWCTALFWVVPAKVEGTWQLPQGQLVLTQQFQMVSGTLTSGGSSNTISDGRLRGDQISFKAGGAQYNRTRERQHDGRDRFGRRRLARDALPDD